MWDGEFFFFDFVLLLCFSCPSFPSIALSPLANGG